MTIRGITLDTGALVAIERRRQKGTHLLELARERVAILSVPVVVVAEWWCGGTDVRERVLDAVNVEPLSLAVVKRRERRWRRCQRSAAVDAIVMAFAANRGDVVFTGDPDDFERLRTFFPTVRVLGVGNAI